MTRTSLLRPSVEGSSLLEVIFSLALVAFSFGALFSIYSSAFPLLRNQQDTIAATLCLEERLDRIRSVTWSVLTDASRFQQDLAANSPRSGTGLYGLVEDITISPYPTSPGPAASIHVTRAANGTATIISQPSDNTLANGAMVRVDLKDTWQLRGRTRTRATSAVIASGGLLR